MTPKSFFAASLLLLAPTTSAQHPLRSEPTICSKGAACVSPLIPYVALAYDQVTDTFSTDNSMLLSDDGHDLVLQPRSDPAATAPFSVDGSIYFRHPDSTDSTVGVQIPSYQDFPTVFTMDNRTGGAGGQLNLAMDGAIVFAASTTPLIPTNSVQTSLGVFRLTSRDFGNQVEIQAQNATGFGAVVGNQTEMRIEGTQCVIVQGWRKICGELAAPPFACAAGEFGATYKDTTGPTVCQCDGSAWSPTVGPGPCS